MNHSPFFIVYPKMIANASKRKQNTLTFDDKTFWEAESEIGWVDD